MNSALRISVAIAWLTVTLIVNPSHADGTLCPLQSLIASVIDQLPVESVNEITPHIEALASIVKGNEMYDFFHAVEEDCHKYQNKLENKKQVPAEEKKIEESQKKKESISYPERGETSDSESSLSDSEGASGANTSSNTSGNFPLKELPEGVAKRYRKKNLDVVLLRRGNKVIVATRKPGEQAKTQSEIDITGKAGDQLVRQFVQAL